MFRGNDILVIKFMFMVAPQLVGIHLRGATEGIDDPYEFDAASSAGEKPGPHETPAGEFDAASSAGEKPGPHECSGDDCTGSDGTNNLDEDASLGIQVDTPKSKPSGSEDDERSASSDDHPTTIHHDGEQKPSLVTFVIGCIVWLLVIVLCGMVGIFFGKQSTENQSHWKTVGCCGGVFVGVIVGC